MTDVAIALVWHSDRFLVGRRKQGDFLAGLWEFPGGKVEPGESPREAAMRECREEAGLEVVVIGPCGDVFHRYDTPVRVSEEPVASRELHLYFFACQLIGPADSPRPPFQWVAASELPLLEFPPANQSLLRRLMDVDFVSRFWQQA
jgi:mutator protein MutT